MRAVPLPRKSPASVPGRSAVVAGGIAGGFATGPVPASTTGLIAGPVAESAAPRGVGWNAPVARPGGRSAAALPVPAALERLLPGGLPRGGILAVEGSLSLLLATMGAASAAGAWCSLVGLPPVSADAVRGFGIAVEHTPVVAAPKSGASRAWAALIAALLDTIDVVAARPGAALGAGDLSRLAARARTKGATLLLYVDSAVAWPGLDLRLSVRDQTWQRAPGPRGRLTARRIIVAAHGRGRFARPQEVGLWLPDRWGRIASADPFASAGSSGIGGIVAGVTDLLPARRVNAR